MKFHFNLGGGDPHRRLYRHSRVRASDYYRPRIYVSFGPLGNAIMSGIFAAIGAFLVLLGLVTNFLLLFIGGLFVVFGVIGVRSNIRAYKADRIMKNEIKSRNVKKDNDDISE